MTGCQHRSFITGPAVSAEGQPNITPDLARAALLELESIRVFTGDDTDPIFLDLQSGTVTWLDESTVTIGRFMTCNLEEGTWDMTIFAPSI